VRVRGECCDRENRDDERCGEQDVGIAKQPAGGQHERAGRRPRRDPAATALARGDARLAEHG
jgi:hypothetical protein